MELRKKTHIHISVHARTHSRAQVLATNGLAEPRARAPVALDWTVSKRAASLVGLDYGLIVPPNL